MSAPVGRPRAFDCDTALDRALLVFWQKGYEGTSLSDLTEALGINRPSLYAAFGNKEALFRKALDRYAAGAAAYVEQALQETTARAAVERLFAGSIEQLTRSDCPTGCLMVQAALSCADENETVRCELIARRAAGEEKLKERFERALAEGDLPENTDCAALARYFMTVIHGMSIQATGGAGREELEGIARTALCAWPG